MIEGLQLHHVSPEMPGLARAWWLVGNAACRPRPALCWQLGRVGSMFMSSSDDNQQASHPQPSQSQTLRICCWLTVHAAVFVSMRHTHTQLSRGRCRRCTLLRTVLPGLCLWVRQLGSCTGPVVLLRHDMAWVLDLVRQSFMDGHLAFDKMVDGCK